jgi:DNA-binding FrmR family transcriptional regulator
MESKETTQILNLLKTARGQMDGVIRMVEEGRYCVDISKQILAVTALLKKANLKIIDRHIKGCVKEAFEQGEGEQKVDEIIYLLDKYLK